MVLSVDATDPLDIIYKICTQAGLIVETVNRYLTHAPPTISALFSTNDKLLYSKKGSPHLLVTVKHGDHPTYVVQQTEGTEFHTLFMFLHSIDLREVDCFSDAISNDRVSQQFQISFILTLSKRR